PGIVDALRSTAARIVGVSPIVGGAAVSGPAAALMRVRGLAVSPLGVADAYAPWLRRLLIDPRDHGCIADPPRAGRAAETADIIMTGREVEAALARRVLDAARSAP